MASLHTALVERQAAPQFTPEQIDLIRRTIAKGATDDELALFLHHCRRTGLDPFSRQIYLMPRRQKNKETQQWEVTHKPETSIDGFRVVAERTGEQDGQEVFWCGEDGSWRDVWVSAKPPVAAKVLVYRKGCTHPFPGFARFDEFVVAYDGKPSGLWAKMPSLMLAKTAEAQALRKAFPHQLSDLYTAEEMAQAEVPPDLRRGTTLHELRAEKATGEPVNVETGEVLDMPLPTAEPATTLDAQELPELPEGQYWIESAWEAKSGVKNGRAWTLFKLRVDGVELATFNETIYTQAVECAERGLPALIKTEQKNERVGAQITHFAVMPRPGDEVLPF